jgi:uncharacterized protein YdiU (UPF0061 family)
MGAANPVYIPRNHQVEAALAAAQQAGDLGPLHRLLDAVSAPYRPRAGYEAYEAPPTPGGPAYQTFCGT